jgi:hypothetical protein
MPFDPSLPQRVLLTDWQRDRLKLLLLALAVAAIAFLGGFAGARLGADEGRESHGLRSDDSGQRYGRADRPQMPRWRDQVDPQVQPVLPSDRGWHPAPSEPQPMPEMPGPR